MKTKLLRRWNFLMDFLFIGGFTYNMSLLQKIGLASSYILNRKMRKLAYDAYLEFNEHHGDFHYLGYSVGIGIMAWRIRKDGIAMHDQRQNVWEAFAHKWRKHSKKWNSSEAKLKRVICGEEE